jgi:hypothetical protein
MTDQIRKLHRLKADAVLAGYLPDDWKLWGEPFVGAWTALRDAIAAAITAEYDAGREDAAVIAQHICDTFGEAAIGRATADAIRSIPSKET